VHQELALDGLEQRLLGAEGVVTGGLVLLEQILDDLVVGLAQADGFQVGSFLGARKRPGP